MSNVWAATLKDEREIAEYISSHSTGYVEEEMIEEFFFNSAARLVKIRLSDVAPGNDDQNISSPRKQQTYAKLNSLTRPPIVLDYSLNVSDGNHRYRDAISKNEQFIWAYVPEETALQHKEKIIEFAPSDGLKIPKTQNRKGFSPSIPSPF